MLCTKNKPETETKIICETKITLNKTNITYAVRIIDCRQFNNKSATTKAAPDLKVTDTESRG